MSASEQKSPLSRLSFMGDASPEYRSRRKLQMTLFFGASALTIFCSRLTYKGSLMRKYVPKLFSANHVPPQFSFATDASVAVGTATLFTGSVFSTLLFGTCWIFDISSMKEFGWKMRHLLGGYESQKLLSQNPMDEESKIVQDTINDILDGKVEFEFHDDDEEQQE